MTDDSPAAANQSPETTTDDEVIALAHRLLDFARQGDAEQLLPLIDAGAPVNLQDPSGNTPLMLAAYHGHAELVTALSERGADVDLLNDRGQSPLAGAAFKGDLPVAKALLAAGADPSLGNPDARATAQYFGREDIVALLG